MTRSLRPTLAAALIAACAGCGYTLVPAGSAPATTQQQSSQQQSSQQQQSSDGGSDGGATCRGMISRSGGSSSSQFSGGSLSQNNDQTVVSCGDGPEATLRIEPDTALVIDAGTGEVRIASGSSADAGPYTVRVSSLQGSSVTFSMTVR